MKIIALGGKGMTGSYLPEDMRNYDLVDGFDITISGELEKIFYDENPDVVINLAAITDVVGSETNPELCYKTNTDAAIRVAQLCKEFNARLIFISSVDVFDGEKKTPYTKYDKPNPIVVYGNSKLLAERGILNILPEAVIVRAGWMFGGFEKDKKFVSYMMKKMLDEEEIIKAVDDIKGSPTYAKDLISCILDVIIPNDRLKGIFHFCNQAEASRFQQACVIAEVMDYKGDVVSCNMKEFPNFRALKNSVMRSSFLARPWRKALTEYIELWKERIK